MASRHGVQTVDYSAVDSVRDVILNLTDGRGVDSAIDAVGMEAGGSLVGSILQSTRLQLDRATALGEHVRHQAWRNALAHRRLRGSDPGFPTG